MASFDGSPYSGRENTSEVERMYRKFTFKCLQIIVQSRIEKTEFIKDKIHYDHDFSLMLLDNARVDEQIRKSLQGVRSFPVKEQSICVEVSLVTNDGDHMFLETWDMTFDPSSVDVAVNKPQHIYTRMGVTLKSLVCATRATPAYRLARNQGERGGGFRLSYRFYLGKPQTHMLGEGFKTCRAGAVPSSSGLLGVSVSFRTRLLLSPDTTHSQCASIEMRDNHFRQEAQARRVSSHAAPQTSPCSTHHVASHKTHHVSPPSTRQVSPASTHQVSPAATHQVSPHTKPQPASSMPQPCSSPHKSPDQRSDSPYCFAVSPGAEREEDFLRAHMAAAQKDDQWSGHSHSVFAMDDLPEPILGAFTDPRLASVPEVTSSDLYQGLLRRSQIAQEMVTTLSRQKDSDTEDDVNGQKTNRKKDRQREMEKENIPTTGRHNLSMEEVDEDFIMKPPFAEEDPNDVKCFLGLIFQAPVMTFDGPGDQVTVEDFVSDVSRLVDKSEGDMAELDMFCQSVVSQGREERDTSPDS